MDGWTGAMDEQKDGLLQWWMDGRMNCCNDGWKDGWTAAMMDGWMDCCNDGWMDGLLE